MNVKNIALGVAIFVLSLFVVIYGVNTLLDRPEYNNFCEDNYRPNINNDEAECINAGGKWIVSSCIPEDLNCKDSSYCDTYEMFQKCQNEYNSARESFSRNAFFIILPVSILLIALGALLFSLESVGGGLMAGGIGAIIYGVSGYWEYSEDWLRFIISLVGLVIVIFIAYFFNHKSGEGSKKR